jgi:putative FmdB family regulatory protein
MPLYDFKCQACGDLFEASTSVDAPAPPCPACGAAAALRTITGFATTRPLAPKGVVAQRSNDSRRIREDARAERKANRTN